MGKMKKNYETSKIRNIISSIGGEKLVLVMAIIGVFLLFTGLNSNFFTTQNIINLLIASSLVGMVAVGHTYLIIAGQNDLSPGSLAAFSGVFIALLLSWGVSVFPAILIVLLASTVVGFFNAWMVNKIKLEAFIATLVTQSIVRGLAFIISDGRTVAISNQSFLQLDRVRILSLPISVWLMILTFIFFGFVLSRTKFGRNVYAVGGSSEAARLAGLEPKRIITVCFLIISVLTALGGIMFAARMNTGQPAANINLEFDAITAVILGGVSFAGGSGSIAGTALGVFLIQSFNTGLIMVNVPSFWQFVARGGLLLFALAVDYIRKERREKELLALSMKNVK